MPHQPVQPLPLSPQLSWSTLSSPVDSDSAVTTSQVDHSESRPQRKSTKDKQSQPPERPHIHNPKKLQEEDQEDILEEYFVQQTKLFRHLEKRYHNFNKRSREEQARAREARHGRKAHAAPRPRPVKETKKRESKDDSEDMIGGVRTALNAGKAAVRPAIGGSRTPSPVSSASFSSSSVAEARASQSKLKKKTKRKVNPDAMTVNEATRVLRALDAANPTSSYSLTLSTKVHKSSLPIRGTISLPLDPRRTSETILVFAEPNSPSAALAKSAGAAYVGGEEIFESVLSGKISPTRCLATPGMMPVVSRALARYLGPKGLMPVAKRGLVGEGEELAEKIRGAQGRMEYRADKAGLVRLPVARMDFEITSVENNIRAFIQTIRDDQTSTNTDDAVTAAAQKKKKGSAIVGARLETTNGPSIELNDVL